MCSYATWQRRGIVTKLADGLAVAAIQQASRRACRGTKVRLCFGDDLFGGCTLCALVIEHCMKSFMRLRMCIRKRARNSSAASRLGWLRFPALCLGRRSVYSVSSLNFNFH